MSTVKEGKAKKNQFVMNQLAVLLVETLNPLLDINLFSISFLMMMMMMMMMMMTIVMSMMTTQIMMVISQPIV